MRQVRRSHGGSAFARRYRKGCRRVLFSTLIRYSQGPWAIIPERLALLLEMGLRFDASAVEAARAAGASRPKAQSGGAVGVIPINGALEAKPSIWSWIFDLPTYEDVRASLRAMVADPEIKGIVLDIDSPGGTAFGLPELAKDIRSLRGPKPIVAVANAEAASAAYYIASQADELVVTPSGQVGSIGTVFLHTDMSGMAEQQGVKFTIVRNPPAKFEGNPYEPLSEEALADIQSKIDAYTGMFQRDVAKGRGVSVEKVRNDFGQGRMLMAKDALAAGMVDRIEPLDAVVERVMRGEVAAKQSPEASTTETEPRMDAAEQEPIDLEERRRRSNRLLEIALMGRGMEVGAWSL